jgi:hypothetical protein
VIVVLVVLAVFAGASSASAASPWWYVTSSSRPSYLPAPTEEEGKLVVGKGQVIVTATNLGDLDANGGTTPVQIRDWLPTGVHAVSVKGISGESSAGLNSRGPVECKVDSQAQTTCTFAGTLPPYDQIEIRIGVEVTQAPAPGESNVVSVSGGEAQDASLSRPLTVSAEPTPFGVEGYEVRAESQGGAFDTQAGSHPFQVTGAFALNQTLAGPGVANPVALPKDLAGRLPPGLIGNPSPLPRCTLREFLTEPAEIRDECSPRTAVGVALVTINEPSNIGELNTFTVPIFNLEPAVGEPARFGFLLPSTPIVLDASVRSGEDYGVTLGSSNISQIAALLAFKLVFWGVPGDARHDNARGWGCLEAARELAHPAFPCNPLEAHNPPPFVSLPTSCLGPLQNTMEGDSWKEPRPAGQRPRFPGQASPPLDGCNRLPFSPSIKVTPDGTAGSSPTGLNVDVHVAQDSVLTTNGLAESNVRNITVALPPGVAVNPAGGDGLQACSQGLAGFTGIRELETLPGTQTATFTPRLPNPLEPGLNFCPDAAKIGTAKIKTPILPNPIQGAVYLATQNENPFGSLIALYIVAEDPVSGVLVKLTGHVSLCTGPGEVIAGQTCAAPGQLISTFENSPQAPFEDAELHFFGGERAPLATPARCGSYTTNATFTPWSGNEPVGASSTFNVTSGPNGTPCPGASLPFSPSLTGGTTNIAAGAFSPLSTTIGRADGNQNMQSVTLHMPPGLAGLLASVKLCPEGQANEGTCGPESLIGETTVSAGVGNDPVSVKGGRVYITEKYAGAPYGLSIVNPVKAGPFDLEHDTSNPGQQPPCDCVIVRAKIEVDRTTAVLTVTTDPSGPHSIPHLIDGIPVQIKKVNVLVNRPGFTFNPTSCNPLALTGSIASDEGASSPVSVPFQVHDCGLLKFSPSISVTTAARGSKANGASLLFKVAYPPVPGRGKGAMGSQAWFNEAKFDLPKQLPARLTTIQKACLAATFESNRGACPAASIIGHAIVHTPVLPVPIEGPVYFVSHGAAKFPDAVLVLQGYGVTVNLVGETFINGKTNVTSATFRNTPDVPFESIEVTIPSGPFSEFGANLPASAHGSFCGQKLIMPTFFKAQNGLEIHQNVKLGVTGCPKHKKPKHAKRGRKATRHRRHG